MLDLNQTLLKRVAMVKLNGGLGVTMVKNSFHRF